MRRHDKVPVEYTNCAKNGSYPARTDAVGILDEDQISGLNGVVRCNVSVLSLATVADGDNLAKIHASTKKSIATFASDEPFLGRAGVSFLACDRPVMHAASFCYWKPTPPVSTQKCRDALQMMKNRLSQVKNEP